MIITHVTQPGQSSYDNLNALTPHPVPTVVLCRQNIFGLAALLGEVSLDATFHISAWLGHGLVI